MNSIELVASFSPDSEAFAIKFPISYVREFIKDNFDASTLVFGEGMFFKKPERSAQLSVWLSGRLFENSPEDIGKVINSFLTLQEILGQRAILIKFSCESNDGVFNTTLFNVVNKKVDELNRKREKVIKEGYGSARWLNAYLNLYEKLVDKFNIPERYIPAYIKEKLS